MPSLCCLKVLIFSSLFVLCVVVALSTETKDMSLCEGRHQCQTSTAGHVLQSSKGRESLSTSTRTLTHRPAFSTLVS